jgi:quinolinate synthase
VVKLADVVGSTTQLIKAAQNSPNKEFIVATDNGILHKMRTLCPDKLFLEAPTAGHGATCTSCSHCPWMAMNGLINLAEVLERGNNEIHVDPAIIPRAVLPIKRMLDFAEQIKLPTRGIGNA